MTPARAQYTLMAGAGALLILSSLACDGSSPTEPASSPSPTSVQRGATATPVRGIAGSPSVTATPEPAATPDLGLLLPDLQTADSDDVYISIDASGTRWLHFSTEVHNTGPGPMELTGEPEAGEQSTTAWQVIQRREAGQLERDIGLLQVNAEHGHWHLDDFADYELWTYTDGSLQERVAASEKVTFCLIDEFPLEPDDYGDGPFYGPCDPYAQGISPGWGETYEAWLPGQSLDITGLPDGTYALRTVLDPENLILESDDESDDDNNIHVMLLDVRGNQVTPAIELAEEDPDPEPTPEL